MIDTFLTFSIGSAGVVFGVVFAVLTVSIASAILSNYLE